MKARPIIVDWDTRDMQELKSNVRTLTRFLKYCEKDEDGLLCWIGRRNLDGYGKIKYRRRTMRAHRLAYALMVDMVPKDMCVLHRNDKPSCVDPAMLFLGTHEDNMSDMVKKGRSDSKAKQGSSNGRAKLTESAVRDIRYRYACGGHPNQSDLAREYGVSDAAISDIITGRHWSHIHILGGNYD